MNAQGLPFLPMFDFSRALGLVVLTTQPRRSRPAVLEQLSVCQFSTAVKAARLFLASDKDW